MAHYKRSKTCGTPSQSVRSCQIVATGLLLTEPAQLIALAMPISMSALSSYEHLPFNDQLSSDGIGTGAHLIIWNEIPKPGALDLEFQEKI